MRSCSTRFGAALACLCALSACAPDFVEQWEVKKPRIATAKVVIDGDSEGRARPRPGESFALHYFLMSPERPQQSYSATLAVCAGTVLTNGTLACLEEIPFPTLTTDAYQGDDTLVLRGLFVPDEIPDVPREFLQRVSLFGAMCVDGDVERVADKNIKKDPVSQLYQCTNNADAEYPTVLPFSMSVWTDLGEPTDVNHHPSFACDDEDENSACVKGVEHELEKDETITTPGSIVLAFPKEEAGDEPREREWLAWPEDEELPWDDCASAPDLLPKLRAETKGYKIYLRVDPRDRETYARQIKVNESIETEERREELVFTHAITTKGGELNGFGSVVRFDAEDAKAETKFEYKPPRQSDKKDEHIEDTGRLVRFFFTLRDQRGGVDFTTRALCVLPPKD